MRNIQPNRLIRPSREDFAALPSTIQTLDIEWINFIDDIPVLPNLEKLTLRYFLRKEDIPRLFNFLNLMPRLSELEFVQIHDTFNNEDGKHLRHLTHLKGIVFDDCTSDDDAKLTEDILSHFALLSNLKKVIVHRSFPLTDLALQYLSTCTFLEEIELEYGSFGDQGLRALSGLKNLKKLYLDECGRATDEGFTSLFSLSSYKEITLRECTNLTLRSLSQLSKADHLLHLELTDAKNLGQGHLTFPKLKKLSLEFCDLKACSLTFPSSLEHLKIRSVLSKEQLLSLESLINLQTLSLQLFIPDQVAATGLQFFRHLKKLHTLDLSYSRFTSTHDLSILKELPQLENLDLSNFYDLDDTALNIISTLENLKSLSLRECQGFTPEGLKKLSKLKNLSKLNLNWCSGISEEIFTHFTNLEKLEELHLRSHQANEAVIRCVNRLPALKILHIIKNKIDAAILQNIVDSHPTLQRVEIERFPTILKRETK